MIALLTMVAIGYHRGLAAEYTMGRFGMPPTPEAVIEKESSSRRDETMKNIQMIDSAENSAYSIYQVSEETFNLVFPLAGQDIEFIEDVRARLGPRKSASIVRTINKRFIRNPKRTGFTALFSLSLLIESAHFTRINARPTYLIINCKRVLSMIAGGDCFSGMIVLDKRADEMAAMQLRPHLMFDLP